MSILISAVPLAATAQVLQGQVLDAGSGEPLPGANVVSLAGQGTTTDTSGKFQLSLKPGVYFIEVSFMGYKSKSFQVSLEKGKQLFKTIRLQPLSSELGEVVVSAGKFEQRIEETTVSIDVIKPALVQDKNQVNLKNTLQQAPGVNVTDGQANIRAGSGWSYGAGTRVQTLVDGMPLISGDANQVQWELVPIQSVERIEVLKGASSVLYGSAALNGVINVLTHPMPERQKLNVNLYSGIYDNPKRESLKWWDEPRFNSGFNFDYQQPINAQNGLVISGGHIQDQGFRYLDDERRTRFFTKFMHQPDDNGIEASLATHIMYSDIGNSLLWESDSLGYIPLDSSITRGYGWDFYIDPKVSYRHGSFKHQLQGRFLKLNNITFDDQSDYTNRSDLIFGEYQLQYFQEWITTTFGATSSFTNSESVLFEGRHTSTNNALFLQLDLRAFGWLTANAGLRYEAFRLDDRFYEKPVFRAGLNAKLSPSTFVRASYGEAFRFPSMAEAYTSTRVGAITVYPNPELSPETGQSYEAGIKQLFRTEQIKGYLDLAIFQLQYYNMIEYNASFWGEFVFPTLGFGFKPLNIGETRIRGIELATALEGDWNKMHYRLLAGYTFNLPQIANPREVFATDSLGIEQTYRKTSTDPENNILKYRYQHLAKFDAQVKYKRFTFGLSLRYNDFMQNVDSIFVSEILTNFVPGVEEHRERNNRGDLIMDCRVGYYFHENWKIDLIIDNLLNREKMIRPAYLGPPRLFSLRLNYSFEKN